MTLSYQRRAILRKVGSTDIQDCLDAIEKVEAQRDGLMAILMATEQDARSRLNRAEDLINRE